MSAHISDCGCLTKIEAQLKAHHKADVTLELKLFMSWELNKLGAALPPLYYKYRAKGKWKKSYVTFNYCPFCGAKNGGPVVAHDEPLDEPISAGSVPANATPSAQ